VVPMMSGNQGLRQVLFIEKAEGYGSVVLDNYNLMPQDVMFVISNSGTNTAGVEVALGAKQRGLKTVAVTSVAQSKGNMSRHSSKKRLFEVADVVIDSCVPAGDAQVEIPGWTSKVGAVSTIIGMTIMQSIASETASILAGRGVKLPVYPSHTSGQNAEEIHALEQEEENLMQEQARRMAGIYR
ncbi:MAG: sugar isomerase domain-containing protein, partial [Anaerolineaceae bacterium]|nr:sugar isomerase domain-containing protein [Anaerolineaceae bacterium]